jgi:adenine-specific DNA-methyltransferase
MSADPAPELLDASSDLDHGLDDLSREELVSLIKAQREAGVRISFAGKATARRLARRVRPRTQRTLQKYSVGTPEEQSRNVVVEGDNLQALVTLYRERGQIDLIVTDPPYNTGNDFRYNDRWEDDPNDPGLGEFVREDDTGRHTKWMRFMWPRLQMMKSMLRPGGVLAICIDQRELFHLGQMLDELFEQKNRLAIINWEKSYSPRNDKGHVSAATEYVLVYAKDVDKVTTRLLPRTEDMNASYRSPDGDPRRWTSGDLSAGKGKTNQGMVYAIQSPFTGELIYPPADCCWRLAQRELKSALEGWGVEYRTKRLKDDKKRAELLSVPVDEIKPASALVIQGDIESARRAAQKVHETGPWPRVWFQKGGEGKPRLKRYLDDVKKGKVPLTWWADDDYDEPLELGSTSWAHEESGHSQTGVKELDAIVGETHGFATVKPLKLISKIVQIWCPPDGVVLDPFAGSGTTGHAVMALNALSGSERRFVLIEQGRPETGDSYARTLTADRLRRVVEGDWANGKGTPLSGGFRFTTLDKKVDAAALLRLERDEMVDTVIASYFDASQRRGQGLVTITDESYRYLVARNADDEGFFLVWDGADANTDFDETVYEACADEAEAAGLRPIYHVYARFSLYQTSNVRFYQIPDRILADFGLDLRSEPFEEPDE